MGRAENLTHPRLADVRSWTLPKFRYCGIYHRPIRNGIEVIHALHAARDARTLLEDEADE